MRGLWIALGGLWLARGAHAQPADAEPKPDLDFLEYLGSWQADDDEWLIIQEYERDNGPRRGSSDESDVDGGGSKEADGAPRQPDELRKEE